MNKFDVRKAVVNQTTYQARRKKIRVLDYEWYDKFKMKKGKESWEVFNKLPFELHELIGEYCNDQTLVNYITSCKDVQMYFDSSKADHFWKKRYGSTGLFDLLSHPGSRERGGNMGCSTFYERVVNKIAYQQVDESKIVHGMENVDPYGILLVKREETEGLFEHDILVNLVKNEKERKSLQIRNTVDFSVIQILDQPIFSSTDSDSFVYRITPTCFLFLFLHLRNQPFVFMTRIPKKKSSSSENGIELELFRFCRNLGCSSEVIKLHNESYCFFGTDEREENGSVRLTNEKKMVL